MPTKDAIAAIDPATLPGASTRVIEAMDAAPPVAEVPTVPMLPEPVVFRCIEYPNEKFVRTTKKTLPDGRVEITKWPKLEFYETWLRVDNQIDHDTVVRNIPPSQLFIEPSDKSLPLQEYTQDGNKVLFATRNPAAYVAFERKMRS